jgi:N-acetyl-anhydromuramyl-L-alanine amidase AmpD
MPNYILNNYLPSLAIKQNSLRLRTHNPCAIIIHQTSLGPYNRHIRNKLLHPTPLDAANHIYSNIMSESGHFTVCGVTGNWVQNVPINYVAHHCANRGSAPKWPNINNIHYHPKTSLGYNWWYQTFPTLTNPNDLAQKGLWLNNNANANTIGIEIVPHINPQIPFSNSCWQSVKYIIEYCYLKYDMERFRENIITHSEANPLTRTSKGKPWDLYAPTWTEDIRQYLLK